MRGKGLRGLSGVGGFLPMTGIKGVSCSLRVGVFTSRVTIVASDLAVNLDAMVLVQCDMK